MVGVPNPQSDWEQADPKKADFIKNKPDLRGLKEEIYADVYTDMDSVREDIVVARDDLEGKINLKADTSYVDDKVANIKITTDDKLSTTSTNPVQNKVVTNALSYKADKKLAFNGYIEATLNEDEGIYEFDFDSIESLGVYLLYEPCKDDDGAGSYYILSVDASYDNTSFYQTLFNLYSGEITQRLNKREWTKLSVSQTDLDKKVDKISGKGLSTEDFTTALKNKLSGIDDEATSSPKVIHFEFENENDERVETWNDKSIFNQYKRDDFYYITMRFQYTGTGECTDSALLLCMSYEDDGWNVDRLLIMQNGEIYRNHEYPEKWGNEDSNVWHKVSVSSDDIDRKINTAIGDIETSLDNIIKKYGLGGDAQ